MGTDALGVTPVLHFLHEFILINEQRSKEVVFADDQTIAGNIKEIEQYRELLLQVDPKYGYYPKPSKSHLIVKEEHLDKTKFIFKGSEAEIAKIGQRHLGAAVGSKEFKREYIESVVNNWKDQLMYLSKIPVYAACIGSCKSKFTYFLRTVPDIHDYF